MSKNIETVSLSWPNRSNIDMTPAIYFFLSLLIGILGNNKKMGFWGYFFGSLIFTPFVGLILLAVSADKKE